MKMTKEEFRKEVKRLGYQVRFKRVGFEDGGQRFFPIIKKNGNQVNGGSVFTPEQIKEHGEVLRLLSDNKSFPV